jgi:hypothetical protein
MYDSAGNRVGALADGSDQLDIPGTYHFSSSDNGPEWATIFTDDNLTFQLEGTDTGTMDFSVSRFGSDIGAAVQINFNNVPLSPAFVGILRAENGVPKNVLEIDADGDGDIDSLYLEGDFPTLKDVIAALPVHAFRNAVESLRNPLLNQVDTYEKHVQKNNYKVALIQLDVLEKQVNKFLVDTTPNEGETSKKQLLNLIFSIELVLE